MTTYMKAPAKGHERAIAKGLKFYHERLSSKAKGKAKSKRKAGRGSRRRNR